jgi:hypothetical protein
VLYLKTRPPAPTPIFAYACETRKSDLAQQASMTSAMLIQHESARQVFLGGLLARAKAAPESDGHYGIRSVLFATDRAVTLDPSGVHVANAQNSSGSLAFGQCEVAVERQGGPGTYFLHLIQDRDADRFYSVQVQGACHQWLQPACSLRGS